MSNKYGVIPIKKTKMSQVIVRNVMAKIQNGEYPVDSQLPPEMKLAKIFNVGRSTVREALSVLKSLNIVSSRQGGGHYVVADNINFLANSMDIETDEYQRMKNLFEVRNILEPEASYLAAQRRTDEDLEKINAILSRFKEILEGNEELGDQEDYEFHNAIVHASHNPFLIDMMTDLSDMYRKTLGVTLKQTLGARSKRQQVYEEHEAIYEAIKEGKPPLAKVQSQIHLENVQKKLNYMYYIRDSIDV